jgi:hypothetical protein
VAGVVPICAAIALPALYFRGTPLSLWSDLPAAYSLEPVGVAILSFCAAIMMARRRVSGWRWLAAGMLLAFGIQTVLLFWGYQFGFSPPQTAGSAGIAGMVGGLMLAAAGVLGAAGIATDTAAPDLMSNQGISDSPTAV